MVPKTTIKQFVRFCVVGTSNTVISLGTILFLFNFCNIDYRVANIIGYTFGFINSFIWNKIWTFESKNRFYKEIIPFLCIFLMSYFLNLGAVIFSAEVLLINKNICQIIGMFFYAVTNFFGNKSWTFRQTTI